MSVPTRRAPPVQTLIGRRDPPSSSRVSRRLNRKVRGMPPAANRRGPNTRVEDTTLATSAMPAGSVSKPARHASCSHAITGRGRGGRLGNAHLFAPVAPPRYSCRAATVSGATPRRTARVETSDATGPTNRGYGSIGG
jgi:hypothetical protein